MSVFFKKALGAANIKITTDREGGRFMNDGSMDDEYEQQSSGGQGPRSSNYRARGRSYNGGRYSRRDYNQHDERGGGQQSVTERLGERLGYKGRGRDRRGRRGGQSYRGRGAGYDNYSRNSDVPSNTPKWYQVTVPFGRKAGKEFIYQNINELLDIPFAPISYVEDGQASIFYVEMSFSSVEALRSINKRITMSNGFKMIVLVKQQDPPVPKVIQGELLEKLMTTMSGLYDTENKVLDLSALHKNEGLKPECLPLNRASVFTTVVNIIIEHIPELVALNLSSNRLFSLAVLDKLIDSTPNMAGLDLSNNEIKESELDRIKRWNLTEINLTGTTIAKKYSQDFNSYLSNIRKKFPNLVTLDGKVAPAPIVFEIDTVDAHGLPGRKSNFFGPDMDVQSLVTQFVQQYIGLFDSDDRASLIDAYHESVTFSTSFWYYPGIDRQTRFDIASSRNLLRIPPTERNGKRVHYGRGAVVQFFQQEFPNTKHLLETLNVDVVHQSPKMLSFTLTGLYEEPNPTKAHKVTRLFSRNFTAIPQGGGIVIISEQLSFTNSSHDKRGQMIADGKNRLATPAEMPSTSALPQSTSAAPAAVAVPPADAAVQEVMLQQFMAESGMNAHWSKECLVANAWDYAGAGAMYARLKGEGKIPEDAFQR